MVGIFAALAYLAFNVWTGGAFDGAQAGPAEWCSRSLKSIHSKTGWPVNRRRFGRDESDLANAGANV